MNLVDQKIDFMSQQALKLGDRKFCLSQILFNGTNPNPFMRCKKVSKKVENFVKQISVYLLRKKSIYDIKYNSNILFDGVVK